MTRPVLISRADARRLAETATETGAAIAVKVGDVVIEFKPAESKQTVPVTLDAWRARK